MALTTKKQHLNGSIHELILSHSIVSYCLILHLSAICELYEK